MNQITIYQENQPPIVFYDDSEYDENVLKETLSFLFTSSKIVKLTTKTKMHKGMAILRPSKIVSISVVTKNGENKDLFNTDTFSEEDDNLKKIDELQIVETKKSEIDIITD